MMLSAIKAGASLTCMARPASYGHLVPCLEILKKSPFVTQTLGKREISHHVPKKYSEGDFSFITNDDQRKWLENAFETMRSKPYAWGFLRIQVGMDLFSEGLREPYLRDLVEKIDKDGVHTHSTMAFVMGHMWQISMLGWDGYIKKYGISTVKVG